MTDPEVSRRPSEISIQARLCNRSRYHTVGDLLTYRSALWVVKGVYIGTTLAGEREMYYILAEAAVSSQQLSSP